MTETDELAAALDEAAARWPELSRGQLITRLALEGHRAASARQRRRRDARLDALRRHSGALTGVYPPGVPRGAPGGLARVIVLDAGVLIGYLDGSDRHPDRAQALLTREVDEDFAVNLLTLAEVLVAPTRTGKRHTVLGVLDDLGVQPLEFPAGSPVTLAQLRAATRLRMPDCCVLLSARDRRARLASFDERVVTAARALGIDVVGT